MYQGWVRIGQQSSEVQSQLRIGLCVFVILLFRRRAKQQDSRVPMGPHLKPSSRRLPSYTELAQVYLRSCVQMEDAPLRRRQGLLEFERGIMLFGKRPLNFTAVPSSQLSRSHRHRSGARPSPSASRAPAAAHLPSPRPRRSPRRCCRNRRRRRGCAPPPSGCPC